jgi:hypothetical protein
MTVARSGPAAPIEPARWVPSGLRLKRDLPFDEWLSLGRRVLTISKASPWCIGDWIVYGQQAYGERYKIALETTQFDYQTLRNYVWVARCFELSRRRDDLSFQHHAEVAALPEPQQELWLDRAQRLRWSRNELRRRVAASRRLATQHDSPTATVQLHVARERFKRWDAAAAAAHQPVEEWVMAMADGAADALLLASCDS